MYGALPPDKAAQLGWLMILAIFFPWLSVPREDSETHAEADE